ncbi:MAG: cyclic nucleotide-binding domain-containing protein [Magnetococcales bacterium]|nr:cyclic nucleotide-binding domain-containing protein [Magnetococcales bacterium]
MVSLFKKMRVDKTTGKSSQKKKPIGTDKATFEHPPLVAGNMVALANIICPIEITSQGYALYINYFADKKQYQIILKSKNKVMSDEFLDPTDRKKKAVTDFAFKALFGLHIHPLGILLLLDQEEDFRGEPRKNQPDAIITSKKPTPELDKLDSKRFSIIDLENCTDKNPLLISINNALLHMQVRPIPNEVAKWGLFLSSQKGIVRRDSPAVAILEPNTNSLIDRAFFTSRASGDGGIDARNWNKAIADPVIMRLMVDENKKLYVEELFTVAGITLLLEAQNTVCLGLPGLGSEERDFEYQKKFAEVLLKLKSETVSSGSAQDIENDLLVKRNIVLAEAKQTIKKINQDGVSMLALELSIKEVLAPFYTDNSGANLLSHEAIALLNSISEEIVGWIESDTNRATAVTAVENAITMSVSELPWKDGIEEIMTMELPEIQTNTSIGDAIDVGDLSSQAKKFLTGKLFIREMRQIAKDLKAAVEPHEQTQQVQKFDALINKMVKGSFERTLVRIGIKYHLLDTESGRRNKIVSEKNRLGDVQISTNEIENILKRYDGYAQFLDRAFDDRIGRSLGTIIQDFQLGSNSEDKKSLNTKPFLTYLIALRASGGAIGSDSDSAAPKMSSLLSVPDVIPNISVLQPTPGASEALLKITHIEGILQETSFVLAPRADNVPDGISNGLWYGFQDLAKFIMGYHLTGEAESSKNQEQLNKIVTAFSEIILLKVINFYRSLNKLQTSDNFEGAVEVIGNSTGLLEIVTGSNKDDELLELKNRPEYVEESPLDLRAALHKVIVELEKLDEIKIGAYRFNNRTRSFAMAATGKGSMVLLPIAMLAKDGLFLIKGKYKDIKFEKSIRLVPSKLKAIDEAFVLMEKKSVKKLSQKALYELLNKQHFFDEFSDYEKSKIVEYSSNFKIYRKDEVILHEKSSDISFFVLIKGHVRAHKGGCNLAKFSSGDIFGEIAFLTHDPNIMTIEARSNVLVLRVDQEMFSNLGPESREKFKNHIIIRQARSIVETINTLQPSNTQLDYSTTTKAPSSQDNDDGDVANIERDEAYEMVKKLNFFEKFSFFEKRRIVALFTTFRTYPANREILHEGMLDNAFFIPIKGEVQVHKRGTVFVELGPDEFFGGLAYMTKEPRTTSIRSKTDVLCMRLDPKILGKLGPEIREKIKDQLISKLTTRLVKIVEKVSES